MLPRLANNRAPHDLMCDAVPSGKVERCGLFGGECSAGFAHDGGGQLGSGVAVAARDRFGLTARPMVIAGLPDRGQVGGCAVSPLAPHVLDVAAGWGEEQVPATWVFDVVNDVDAIVVIPDASGVVAGVADIKPIRNGSVGCQHPGDTVGALTLAPIADAAIAPLFSISGPLPAAVTFDGGDLGPETGCNRGVSVNVSPLNGRAQTTARAHGTLSRHRGTSLSVVLGAACWQHDRAFIVPDFRDDESHIVAAISAGNATYPAEG